MNWVLIVWISISSYAMPQAALTSADFDSELKCREAQTAIKTENLKAGIGQTQIMSVCVQK